MARFLIRRLDVVDSTDGTFLEVEGLTIGRLSGNDVVLNNRAISRTHAGIKDIQGEFWLFNLSTSNGTFLNGAPADRIPLANGDVIQIGPYFLQVQFVQNTLSITVKIELEVQSVAAKAQDAGSMMAAIPAPPQKKAVSIGGSLRPSGTGFLTSIVPPPDEEALRIFWEKRKREAGKIGTKTLLRPAKKRAMGKTQFNWRPNLDLRSLWRKSVFAWGGLAVAVCSLIFLLVYMDAYSPASISSVHLSGKSSQRPIAKQANDGGCSNCHGIFHWMQTNCASCHTVSAFDPSISRAHQKAGIGCVGCHGEHRGMDYKPGFVDSVSCISCHNDRYIFGGRILGIPHGGTVGYPVKSGKWVWAGVSQATWKRKQLPAVPSDYTLVEQFHLIHLSGRREGRLDCRDCHVTAKSADLRFRTSAAVSCDRCHSTRFTIAAGPECVSCHQQHGRNKNQIVTLRTNIDVAVQKARYENIPLPGLGGAEVQRQDLSSLTPGSLFVQIGGIRWFFWIALVALLCGIGFVVVLRREREQNRRIVQTVAEKKPEWEPGRSIDIEKIKREGPSYPHPVIDPVLCIGCHACVEACPHDVLAIVNGVSVPVAPDQCMEDTGCEAECPTSPKACVVLNTKKVIPPRKVPKRDSNFATNVDGIYLIGDISGVPLIKNAVNEGAQVIDFISESLKQSGGNAEFDVAIVGIGPGGLSAAVLAKQKGLKYVAIEQDIVASTIQNYPAGKYVFYKPDTVRPKGGIPVPGPGGQKEDLLNSWMEVIRKNNLKINDEETCKEIRRENGVFRVVTESGKTKERAEYTARKVILAVGTRGAPMKLGAPGEDLTFAVYPSFICSNCGTTRTPGRPFCPNCGQKFEARPRPEYGCCTECGTAREAEGAPCRNCGTMVQAPEKPQDLGTMEFSFEMLKELEERKKNEEKNKCRECGSPFAKTHRFCAVCGDRIRHEAPQPYYDNRVKYKLSNPDDYIGKKCIVVGGGNSAIEAAADLSGFKRVGDRCIFVRDNEVTLLVRSDFKGDLKLGNKINIYECMDAGKVKVMFGAAIKEITEGEVVIINVRSKQEIARMLNDYVFALIGGEKPTKFLESVGIKIG